MKQQVLFPETVAVAKYGDITNDTIHNIETLISTGFSGFDFAEEMVRVSFSEETFEPTVLTSAGFAKVDSIRVSHEAQVTITQNALQHTAIALAKGLHPDDVSTALDANYSGAVDTPDGTAEAAIKPASMHNEWMTLLIKCKLRQPADGHFYVFVPKAVIKPPQQQMDLIHNGQVKPSTTFEALAIDDSADLAKFQAIFAGVASQEVLYIFNGKTTV